jgi:nitroreductase
MSSPTFIPLITYHEYPVEKMKRRAAEFYADIRQRRTVREFSDRPVPLEVIKDCLRAAGSAPSGANLQPWHFVVVSDPNIKRAIRSQAEKEEYDFYHHTVTAEYYSLFVARHSALKPKTWVGNSKLLQPHLEYLILPSVFQLFLCLRLALMSSY